MVFSRFRLFLIERIFLQLGQVLGDAHGALGVVQDVLDLRSHGIRSPGHVRRPDRQDRQVRPQPLLHVVGDHADVVAPLHPQAQQPAAKASTSLYSCFQTIGWNDAARVFRPLNRQLRFAANEFQHQSRYGITHGHSPLD